jgi:hypothetical protein
MSTATISPATGHPAAPGYPAATDPPAAADCPTVRSLLIGYGVTLLPLLVGLVALELGWELSAASTWVPAAAAVTGWALAVAGWLRLRGWEACTALTVIGTPAAVLAAPLAVGWLFPAGLVLWGPFATVLTAALALTAQPPARATAHRADPSAAA